jgi:transmembrane sensor
MTDRPSPVIEQAAYWCLRVREGGMTSVERGQLEIWLEQAEENRASFSRMLDIWEGVSSEEASIDSLAQRSAALVDLQRRKSVRKMRQGVKEFFRVVNPRRYLKQVGATLCALMLGGAAFHTLQAQATVYETARGQTQVLQLTDGSILRMDADTRLRVRMTRFARRIWVEKGRARLEVAMDKGHALHIFVGDRRITALVGVLSVEHLGNETAVTMLSGNANIEYAPSGLLEFAHLHSDAFPTTVLGSHEELISYDAQPVAVVRAADPNVDDVWKNGLLAFDNEPIASALERVNRYASHPVMLDRLSRQVQVSGIYRTGDTRAFVEGVCAVSHLSYHVENGTYKITDKVD